MGDVAKAMQQKIDEMSKKHPDLKFSFIDSNPDVLRERTQVDGYQVYKEGDQAKAGSAGEVRVGDLILAARPRKEAEEEDRRASEKSRNQIHAPVDRFYGTLEQMGGRGKYLKPMTPGELDRDRGTWKGGKSS